MNNRGFLIFLKTVIPFGAIGGTFWILLIYFIKELRLEIYDVDDLFTIWIPLTHALSALTMVVMVHFASRWYNKVLRFLAALGLTCAHNLVAYTVFIGGVFVFDLGPSSLERAIEDTLLVVLAVFLGLAVATSFFAKKLSRKPTPTRRSTDVLDEDLL